MLDRYRKFVPYVYAYLYSYIQRTPQYPNMHSDPKMAGLNWSLLAGLDRGVGRPRRIGVEEARAAVWCVRAYGDSAAGWWLQQTHNDVPQLNLSLHWPGRPPTRASRAYKRCTSQSSPVYLCTAVRWSTKASDVIPRSKKCTKNYLPQAGTVHYIYASCSRNVLLFDLPQDRSIYTTVYS